MILYIIKLVMRKPFLAANWKMNKTVAEALEFLDGFLPEANEAKDVDIVIAPAFTALWSVSEKLRGTNVMLSAQDVFYEEKGAFTGEVSPLMLRDLGCSFTIVGHSERRQYFGETDETVNKKIRAALAAGLGVIFCIGESLEQRQSGRTNDVLRQQLRGGLKDVDIDKVVTAYEPIWAIGTGVTATVEQAEDTHKYIRREISSVYGDKAGSLRMRILYGGSVTADNAGDLMACPDVDGALVGGASLKAESFVKILKGCRPSATGG